MKEIMKALSLLTQIGISMFVPIFLCIIIGSWIDKLCGTDIIFLVIFTVLGVGAAFRTLYMLTAKMNKKDDNKDNKK